MNTLGLRITSSVLATALCVAPVNSALAAPEGEAPADAEAPAAEGDAAPAEGEGDAAAPAEGEGEAAPAEGEGDAAAPEGEGEPAAEGETPAEGEGAVEGGEAAAEGETPAEGEGETAEEPPAEETPEEVDAGEGEGEGEEGEDEGMEDEEMDLDGPMRPPEPAWGPKKQYPMNGKGALIGGGVVTGVGAGAIVTSLLLTSCNFNSSLSCRFNDQRDFLVPLSVTATGLGLMLIGVGIGNRIKYKKWENWTPEKESAVVPTMVPGGGGLAWVGRF